MIFAEVSSRKIVAVAGIAAAGKKLHPDIGNGETNLKAGLTLRLRLPFVGNSGQVFNFLPVVSRNYKLAHL